MINNELDIREEAKKHLANRYGGEFEFFSHYGVGYVDLSVDEMLFKRPGEDNEILVVITKEEDELVYRDNYLAVKFKQETAEFVTKIGDELLGEFTVFVTPPYVAQDTSMPVPESFDEYLEQFKPVIFGTIVIPVNGFTAEYVDKLAEGLLEAGLLADFRLIVVDDKDYADVTLIIAETLLAERKHCISGVISVYETKKSVSLRERGMR